MQGIMANWQYWLLHGQFGKLLVNPVKRFGVGIRKAHSNLRGLGQPQEALAQDQRLSGSTGCNV
jgi:hypothetical protein